MADPSSARSAGHVFVVDDDAEPLRLVERALTREGYTVTCFESAAKVLEALRASSEPVDLLISDITMPKTSGLELLAMVRESWPDLVVILLTGRTELSVAVDAVRRGAYDYLTKPVDPLNTLVPAVRRAVEHGRLIRRNLFLQAKLDVAERSPGIIGDSKAMREVHALVAAVAPTDATVLVLGESGTGKELVARAIHAQSKRAGKPFIDVNCGALSESVLESELFGHEKGAFTGAVAARRGLIEEASGGTLFLDEVGELAPATQVRLLRVLQERTVRPVGSSETREVDVRVIAATNRDLSERVELGEFRQDLFYRLDVMSVHVPPLRERVEDIPALVHHFLRKHSVRLAKRVEHVDAEALEQLAQHHWPGNVRELENAVERAIVLAKGDTLGVELLPSMLRGARRQPAGEHPHFTQPFAEAKLAFERDYLERLLARAEGKLAQAARLAGVDASNLRRLLKRHGLEPGRGGS